MEESPEQARYTASLNLFYIDQEKIPFPDTFVFVPALRRSLRLASTARCSPVFGFDWSYDDAKTNGFNGSTSIYTGDFLGDRKILTLAHFNQDGAIFPDGYLMPLGFPEAVVGQMGSARAWRSTTFTGSRARRPATATPAASSMPTKSTGMATGSICSTPTTSCGSRFPTTMTPATCPGLGHQLGRRRLDGDGFPESRMRPSGAGFGNPWKRKPYLDSNAPKEYFDGVKYGSPAG